jgi:hypothetical protein
MLQYLSVIQRCITADVGKTPTEDYRQFLKIGCSRRLVNEKVVENRLLLPEHIRPTYAGLVPRPT